MEAILGLFGGWLGPVLAALGAILGVLFVGKKVSDGKVAKREAEQQKEILEDVQVASSIRADDSDDPKQRLRDQSHRDS